LDDIIQELLGPIRWSPAAGSSPWAPTFLGLPKRGLLRAALARLRRVPSLGRYARDVSNELEEAEAFAAREEARAAGAAPPPAAGGRGVIGFDLGPDPEGAGGGEEEGQEQRAPGAGGGDGGGGGGGAAKTPVWRMPASGDADGGGGLANGDAGQRSPLQQLP
jgi:hypothetical protein